MRIGDRIDVTAHGLDDAGAGIGDANGLEVHIDDLLPGERALVEIEHCSPHRPQAWARIAQRQGALSPDRVAPACPAFGRCGGCRWQHLAYPAQLAAKQQRVQRALGRDVDEIVGAPAITGYRNKGKYVIADDGRGELVLGAYQPRSHQVVSTLGCQVVAPAIDRAATALRERLADSGLPAYDERRRAGALRYLVLRADAADQMLACLVTTSGVPRAAIDSLAQAMLAEVGGVSWATNDRASGALFDGAAQPVAGASELIETVAGVDLALDATAFFQVNREQAHRLYDDVTRLTGAGPTTRAVDLYCGVGGIAFSLAARGADVTGVESHASAAAAANAAAAGAGLADRVRFVTAAAATLADHAAGRDLLVVNPPRKGLDGDTRRAVRQLAIPTLAYVSCGPDSLARDLGELADLYQVERARPFDLMPGTAQVETLAVLRRR